MNIHEYVNELLFTKYSMAKSKSKYHFLQSALTTGCDMINF